MLGGPWGTTSLPVVFGLLGTLVVPKKQTLAVTAGALLKAGMTKGDRISRVLEQMMCMELPFAGHSDLSREAWLIAVWLVFGPGKLYR